MGEVAGEVAPVADLDVEAVASLVLHSPPRTSGQPWGDGAWRVDVDRPGEISVSSKLVGGPVYPPRPEK